MDRRFLKWMPKRIRSFLLLQKIYYFPKDTIDLLLGRRDELTPPRGEIFTGSGDFKRIGEQYLRYFIDLGGLKPDQKVLDVGCGIGRMALRLVEYLDSRGAYEGFDVVPGGIAWCRKKITPRYANFHFQLADVYNGAYNPNGKHRAAEYRFPYPDERFDFSFLTSIFTHLLPPDVENYLFEISRTLKNGGRCMITFFLLNAESLALIDSKQSGPDFECHFGNYRVSDRGIPETAVAYDETYILELYAKYGLDVVEPIHYGSWCGRERHLNYQDIVVAVKRPHGCANPA